MYVVFRGFALGGVSFPRFTKSEEEVVVVPWEASRGNRKPSTCQAHRVLQAIAWVGEKTSQEAVAALSAEFGESGL